MATTPETKPTIWSTKDWENWAVSNIPTPEQAQAFYKKKGIFNLDPNPEGEFIGDQAGYNAPTVIRTGSPTLK